jgi:hypothetical protein
VRVRAGPFPTEDPPERHVIECVNLLIPQASEGKIVRQGSESCCRYARPQQAWADPQSEAAGRER